MWAIVGSSGFENFEEFEVIEELNRETPFGLCSNGFKKIKVDGHEALFLCRTGYEQSMLPSNINHRANIYALKKHGATGILAVSSVRSLRYEEKPGDMVVPYQFIDRTKRHRGTSFCDDNLLGFVSLSHPICETAANTIKDNRNQFDFDTHFGQIYVCIEGPQFPTMVDAKCFRTMGGSVMGMTGYPEYALAREAGLHYVPCNFIVDYVPWEHEVERNELIIETRENNYLKALNLIRWVVSNLTEYAQRTRHGSCLATSLNVMSHMTNPEQRAWYDVIIKQVGLSRQTPDKVTPKQGLNLYTGTKPLPKKLQEFLSFVNKYKTDKVPSLDSVRKNADSLHMYSLKPVSIASVKDFAVKQANHKVSVRVYHPDPSQKLPISVYVHGGGFVSGSLDAFDSPVRMIAQKTNRAVLSVDYRLAPENKAPAALEDVVDVIKWAYEHGDAIKADSSRIGVIGDSAGANLATLAANQVISQDGMNLEHQVLIYPTTDMDHDYESMDLFSHGYMLDAKQVLWYRKQYLPENMNPKDPKVSPLYADHLDQLPKTFIITAGYDPLRDEGIAYAEKLHEHGVPIKHYHFDNMIHAFINFGKLVPDELETLGNRIKDFINESMQ